MNDFNWVKWTVLSTALLGAALPVIAFGMSVTVCIKRREKGFVLLALVLGYYAIQSVLSVFGISLARSINDMRSGGRLGSLLSLMLLYFPSVLTLAGWSLLALKKKMPNQTPEPMPLKRHGSS